MTSFWSGSASTVVPCTHPAPGRHRISLASAFLTVGTCFTARLKSCPSLVTSSLYSNSKNALERGCTGFGDGVVLIARAAAHADGTHNLAATLQWDAAGEDHDLAVVRGMDAEKLPARLRVGGEIFGGDVESPRGVGLLDGDVNVPYMETKGRISTVPSPSRMGQPFDNSTA
jgi:hypothetical protein